MEEEQQEAVRLDKIRTHCKALDALTDGGLATGTITQIFGEKALGKSIISFQAACSTVASGSSAIILDTEQSYLSYLIKEGKWGETFSRRFGKEIPIVEAKLEKSPKPGNKRKPPVSRSQLITALSSTLDELGILYTDSHLNPVADILCPDFQFQLDVKQPSVMVLQMPEVTELLNLHGIDAAKIVSEGGRVELRLRSTPVYQSVLHQIVRDTKAKLLVYDSISAPFKSTFPSTQDLPARSAGLAMILSHAQRLCVEFGIAVVVVSHLSIDPINAWDRKPYGGVILGHEAKFSLELTKGEARRGGKDNAAVAVNPEDQTEKTKRIWAVRHPALEDYSRFGYVLHNDGGFH